MGDRYHRPRESYVCSVPDCERTDISSRGMCRMHYLRWLRHGTTEQRYPDVCRVEGCERKVRARGLCNRHHLRWLRRGSVEDRQPRMCKVAGCEGRTYGWGLCRPHWYRMKRYGTTAPRRSQEQIS